MYDLLSILNVSFNLFSFCFICFIIFSYIQFRNMILWSLKNILETNSLAIYSRFFFSKIRESHYLFLVVYKYLRLNLLINKF